MNVAPNSSAVCRNEPRVPLMTYLGSIGGLNGQSLEGAEVCVGRNVGNGLGPLKVVGDIFVTLVGCPAVEVLGDSVVLGEDLG